MNDSGNNPYALKAEATFEELKAKANQFMAQAKGTIADAQIEVDQERMKSELDEQLANMQSLVAELRTQGEAASDEMRTKFENTAQTVRAKLDNMVHSSSTDKE